MNQAQANVVTARKKHIWQIAANMRQGDKLEIAAMGFNNPFDALLKSYETSRQAWTVLLDDEPILMFGVSPVSELSGLGSPWLLGTDKIFSIKKQFIKESRTYVDALLNTYPRLMNYVDCRNKASIRWLQWLGFTLDKEIEIGINGEVFYPFRLEKERCVHHKQQ